jgi:serine/threonine protein kinase
MERISEKRFPLSAKDYKLYEEVGEGVSASVYRALCIPLNEIVAIKVLDLEKCNNDLVCMCSMFIVFSFFCMCCILLHVWLLLVE